MPTVDSGLKDLAWNAKDTGVVVVNNDIADEVADSPYVSLLDPNSLLPDQIMFSFSIDAVVAGGTYNMKVYAVFSEDGQAANDPPTGSQENKKILVASLTANAADELLNRSNIYAVPCLAKFIRLVYQNDDSGQQVTISSRYAPSYQQSYSA